MDDLRTFLAVRGLTHDAAGILADVSHTTIGRICAGTVRARPSTVVRLARSLGVSASRMRRMCDAAYLAAHSEGDDEAVPA